MMLQIFTSIYFCNIMLSSILIKNYLTTRVVWVKFLIPLLLIIIAWGYHNCSLGSYDIVSQKEMTKSPIKLSINQPKNTVNYLSKRQKYQYIDSLIFPIKDNNNYHKFKQQVYLNNLDASDFDKNTTWQQKMINISKVDSDTNKGYKSWQQIYEIEEKSYDPWEYDRSKHFSKVFHSKYSIS